MKKLFSFRSVVPNNSNSNPMSLARTYSDNDMVVWDKTWANNEMAPGEEAHICARSLEDSTLKSHSRFHERDGSSNLLYRRSLSFSSQAIDGDLPECKLSSFSDRSRSPSSCGDSPHCAAACHMQCHTFTPPRYTSPKRDNLISFPHSKGAEKMDSPNSSRGCQFSTGSSPSSSPIRLRCGVSHFPQFPQINKVLDRFIDRENNMNIKSKPNSRKKSFEDRSDYCLEKTEAFPRKPPLAHSTAPCSPTCNGDDLITNSYREEKDTYDYASTWESRRDDQNPISLPRHAKKTNEKPMHVLHGKIALSTEDYDLETRSTIEAFPRKPPLAHSTAPCSPTCNGDDLITNSFREEKDTYDYASTWESRRDDQKPISLPRHDKKTNEKPMHVLHGKIALSTEDYDLETRSTIEDIYVDSSHSFPSNSDDIAQDCYTDQYTSYGDFLQIQTQDEFLDNRDDKRIGTGQLNTDELLLKRLKDVDKTIKLLSDDELELEGSNGNCSSLSSMLQMIKNINRERKFLALELSSQMKHRLAERSASKERFRLAKLELNTRTRRLEKEKNEIQFSLEKELDRRSSSWSMNLEKFKSEEQRLRERVRELAEQNISLQREVSSLRGIEEDAKTKCVNFEMQLKDMTASLEQVRTENHNLQQVVSKLEDKLNGLEEEKSCIRKIFGEKDRENKEFHKLVVKLQRICNEQDKTISGLRQGFSIELEKDDHVTRLQIEQLRLTGVEQNLRREVDSCRQELESLRRENIGLLSRLQATGNGCVASSIKLDEELHTRIDCLQTQGLSLMTDISHLNAELLEIIKHKQVEHGQEASNVLNGYSIFDFTIKSQNLRRQYENYKTSLQSIGTILDEKLSLATILAEEGGASKQSEDKLEFELKSEIILGRVLREKLCSKEGELENLHAELASSLRVHDVMQTEIQRLQDEVSYLTHKIKDMEIQMLRKDENIKQLQHEYQERSKELTASQSMLMKISEERNRMWEEVKGSRETIMLMNHEVISLRKKIDDLDEDILTKEGQIAILKDSIDKPFDIIGSPRSVKQFSAE